MAERDRRTFGDVMKIIGASILNPGFGLMAAHETSPRTREKRALENDLRREALQAQRDLPGLLESRSTVVAPGAHLELLEGGRQSLPGKRVSVPTHQTPEGQQQLLGLLARIDAGAAAKAAMPQRGRANTTQNRIDALLQEAQRRGLSPSETNAFIDQNMTGVGGNPLEAALTQLMLQQRQQDLDTSREQEEREADEFKAEENTFVNNLQVSGDSLLDLARVNERLANRDGLEGFLTRPGIPLGQLRRDAASMFDEDAAADIDRFNSLTNQIAISRLDTEGFDGNTNARFSAFTSTKPSFNALGPANNGTIRDNLRGVLLADEARGFVLPSNVRKKYEREVKRLEGLVGNEETGATRSVVLPDGRIMDDVPANVTDEEAIRMAQGR